MKCCNPFRRETIIAGLCVVDDKIEICGYGEGDTLGRLIRELEAFRLQQELKTRCCENCGECCHQPIPVLGCDFDGLPEGVTGSLGLPPALIPEQRLPEQRRKAVRDLMLQHDLTAEEAALLYEYNHAEPIILPRKEDGSCCFLEGRRCSIYPRRPLMCRLYLCNMGEKLSILYEMIIGQGIWHAYVRMGWIDERELSHNPFLRRPQGHREEWEDVPLQDFDFKLDAARDRLFFYF